MFRRMGKRRRCPLLLLIVLVSLLAFSVVIFQMPVAYDQKIILRDTEVPGWPAYLSRNMALYVRPNVSTVIIPAEHVCSSPRLLLVVVCSAVDNLEARTAIRMTWASAKYVGESARVVFFLGASTSADVQEESVRFGDIVQENFVDSYNNLSLKSVMMLKWVDAYCQNVQYIMKTDDDSFVNVFGLSRLVESEHAGLLGMLVHGATPIRNSRSKWYSPEYMYHDDIYPDYLSGTGYVMTRDVASRLYASALVTDVFHLEDVYLTGICARRVGIEPKGHPAFSYSAREFAPCDELSDTIVTSHSVTPKILRRRWCSMEQSCNATTEVQTTLKTRTLRFILCMFTKVGLSPSDFISKMYMN